MNSIAFSSSYHLEHALEQKIRAELEKRLELQSARGLKRWRLQRQINRECKALLKKAMPSAQTVF